MGSRDRAPAPDPRQLALAARQQGLMEEEFAFNRDTFNNTLLPMAIQQQELGMQAYEDQRRLQDISLGWAQQDRARGEAALGDYERSLNQRYSDAGISEARGLATAEAQQGVSEGQGQLTRQMGRMGINPNSGRYASLANQNQIAGSLAAAQAGSIADRAMRAEGLQMRGNLAAARSGNASGFLGMSGGFGSAALGASGAGMGAYQSALGSRAAGQQLGLGFGNAANSGYNSYFGNQMAQYNANQAGGGWGDALGSIVGTGVGMFAGGLGQGYASSLFKK